MPRQQVSLIATVRNEEHSVAALLDSIVDQTRFPDEVVINDCLCTDRTMEVVQQYRDRLPLRTTAGGANISQGRNAAIRAAQGPLIACTDAGLRLDPRWLEKITAPLERGQADLVAGFFQADPRTPFERVLGAMAFPRLEEIDPERFLPAGQSMAFTRAAWEAVGGFPEQQPYCEDLLFALRLLRAGFRKVFVPEALIYFRPRSSAGAFFRQYRHYAFGDGLAGLWTRRHVLRYGSYLAGLGLLAAGWRRPILWAPLLLGGSIYLGRYFRRVLPVLGELPPPWRVRALLLVPYLRLVGDVAKMVGYPQGVWERMGESANGRMGEWANGRMGSGRDDARFDWIPKPGYNREPWWVRPRTVTRWLNLVNTPGLPVRRPDRYGPGAAWTAVGFVGHRWWMRPAPFLPRWCGICWNKEASAESKTRRSE